MCGRFANTTTIPEIIETFNIERTLIENYKQSGNIFPSEEISAIIYDTERKLVQFRWGFLPSWIKDIHSKPQINARAETIAQKPFYKQSFKKRRTLIITNGFYEWKPEGKEKIPVFIRMKNGEPFLMAGIYDFVQVSEEKRVGTCAIITTEANKLIKTIHDRMPVIIKKADMGLWLDCGDDENEQLVLPFLNSDDSDELELIPGRFKDKLFIPSDPDKKIK